MTPEGRIKKKLDTMLKRYHGVAWYFCPQGGAYGTSGVPDRIVCLLGEFIGIEAKADAKKKPTKLQEHCMGMIEKAGGRCFVVYDDASILVVEQYIQSRLIDTVNKRLNLTEHVLAGNRKG